MTCPNVRGDTTQYCTLNCDHGDLLDRLSALSAEVDRLNDEQFNLRLSLVASEGETALAESQLSALAAVVAAVHTALDVYDKDWRTDFSAAECITATRAAVGR